MIKSPAKKQGILYLSDGRNLAASASSCEAKSASTSEAPSPSHSERAASAFRYYPVPVASSSHLRTSRTKGKKHLLCERTLAGQS